MAKHWNFGTPIKGQVLVDRRKLSVRHAGRVWNGHWELDGDKLQVCSAYGSRTAPAGPEKGRAERAEALLVEIVAERR